MYSFLWPWSDLIQFTTTFIDVSIDQFTHIQASEDGFVAYSRLRSFQKLSHWITLKSITIPWTKSKILTVLYQNALMNGGLEMNMLIQVAITLTVIQSELAFRGKEKLSRISITRRWKGVSCSYLMETKWKTGSWPMTNCMNSLKRSI